MLVCFSQSERGRRPRHGEGSPLRRVWEARRSGLRRTSPSSNSIVSRWRCHASPMNRIFSISNRSRANKAARTVFDGKLRIVFSGEGALAAIRDCCAPGLVVEVRYQS